MGIVAPGQYLAVLEWMDGLGIAVPGLVPEVPVLVAVPGIIECWCAWDQAYSLYHYRSYFFEEGSDAAAFEPGLGTVKPGLVRRLATGVVKSYLAENLPSYCAID